MSDKDTLNKLKYTLFGTHKELTKSDLSKFLSAAYRVSGANDKGTKDLFIANHATLISDIFNNEDVTSQLKDRFNKAKDSLLNYNEKLQAKKQKEKDKADREIQKAEKEIQKEKDELDKKRQKATQIDIKAAVTAGKENRELKREKDKAEKAENARLTAEKNKADRERQREINRAEKARIAAEKKAKDKAEKARLAAEKKAKDIAEKARIKAEEERQKAEEIKNINTSMDNFIRVSTSDFDADFKKLRYSSNRYLQQTTSRLKLDVVRKISDSKLTKDLRTYRASKKERHKAIVNSSVSDFITKANESLNKWEQKSIAEAEKLYNGRKREKTKALGEIAKLKKDRQSKIRLEAREMKNEALEKFHDAIYS